jgi:hypothetical protein
MRATRSVQRAEREAATQRTTRRSSRAGGRDDDDERTPIDAPAAAAIPTPPTQVVPERVVDHADCDARISVLCAELFRLEERYNDLELSRWILAQKYERALGRMRTHDPRGINWLVEQLAEWERDVDERRTRGLQEPSRERARRRHEEEFERRLELARRSSPR